MLLVPPSLLLGTLTSFNTPAHLQMPPAAAYFPLAGRDLSSAFPAGQFEGAAENLSWEEDPAFGLVLTCDEVGLHAWREWAGAASRQRQQLACLC